MRVRAATPADLPTLERLWRDFCAEVPPPEFEDDDADEELREVAEIVAGEIALVAEDEDGTPVGFVLARRAGERLGRVTDLYVVPGARRTGVARALVREAAERLRAHGLEAVDLDVMAGNAVARAVYAHWGFRDEVLRLVARLDELAPRLEADVEAPTRGVVYVQTDDFVAVERAVTAFAPRIGSRRSHVEPPVEGWTRVRDEVAEREPGALRRLARELSERLGAVVLSLGIEAGAVVRLVALERGSVVDEYLSVPEFHGPLPPGDVVAMAANPRVLARLTGADPAAIRAAAPTARSPGELAPALQLAAGLAAALGLPPLDG